jgi:hypothetical protein
LIAVEDIDAVGARVSDIHAASGPVDVGMVEAWLGAFSDRDEVDPLEAHASARWATSFWHQA